jgi:membrane protein
MNSLKNGSKKIAFRLIGRINGAREFLRNLYLKLNKATGGSLGILRHTFTNFSMMRGPEAAASLSYYAIFSIFPTVLAIVSIGSMFLEQAVVRQKLLEAILQILPVSATFVNNLISGVLDRRGAFTVLALLSLVWSASNVFDKIIVNVNRAFPKGRNPGFLQSRAMALVIILVLVVLFLGSLMVDTLKGFFAIEKIHFGNIYLTETALYDWLRLLVPIVIKFLLFLAIYSWVPRNTSIRFRAKLIGAVVAAGLWELATRALTWALSNGFANYEPVYGSLSSIIALMTWMYLSGYIVFWGAHLVHAVNYHFTAMKAVEETAETESDPEEEISDDY